MTTLLDQAIEKLGIDNIKEIHFNICHNSTVTANSHIKNLSIEKILKLRCGIYAISIKSNKGFFAEAAYIHASIAKNFITQSRAMWSGTGLYKNIPIYEGATGSECLFCTAKSENLFISEALDEFQKAYSNDPYYSYIRPDIKEIINLKNKFDL